MTDEQKYAELLREIGRLIHEKNDTLIIQQFQIDDLKKQLADAKKRIEETEEL